MELTKELLLEYARDYSGYPATCADEIWKAVQEDRQRVRDEAIAEVKRDHFRIGEKAEVFHFTSQKWVLASVVALLYESGNVYGDGASIRRITKTRPMTRGEKIEKVKEHLPGHHSWLPNELKDGTLDDLLNAYGVPTEVEDA